MADNRQIEYMALGELMTRLHPENPKQHDIGAIIQSYKTHGFVASGILDDRTGLFLAGHGRIQALNSMKRQKMDIPDGIRNGGDDWLVPVQVGYSSKNDIQAKAYIVADNKLTVLGGWNEPALAELLQEVAGSVDVALEATGYDADDLDQLLQDLGMQEEPARRTLAEQFIVPPFTVLDARQGYWQKRKRAWIALGLKGELGRGANIGAIPPNEETRLSPRYRGKEAATSNSSQQKLTAMQRGNRAKDFGTEGNIAPMVKGQAKINSAFGPPEGAGGAQSQTGTSIFDPVLCEVAYRWFCPPGGVVVNPTAGESVYGIVAGYLGYKYKGVELRQEQIDSNVEQAINIGVADSCQWVNGDGVEVCNLLGEGAADFVMCCPPYYDLEIYSDLENDLSNLQTYGEFIEMYSFIILESVRTLKNNRFAMFTVGDIRDKHGHYRNFVSDTIQAFLDAGMQLYNEAILITAIGSLPIRVSAQFPKGRKLGKGHQNVLIFIKGDWRQAVADCGHVEVYTPDGFGEDNYG